MERIRFEYQRQIRLSNSGAVGPSPNDPLRPFVRTTLIGPQGLVSFSQGLVDTGANVSLFSDSIVRRLGIKPQPTSRRVWWRGNPMPIQVGEIDVEIENDAHYRLRWRTRVYFTPKPMPYPLLGQEGCLEFFVATFADRAGFFELAPIDAFPGSVIFPAAVTP